jgi:hypothetical protein
MSRKRPRSTIIKPSKQKTAMKGARNARLGISVFAQKPAHGLAPSDIATMLDKEWFRSHPYRSHRLRRAIPGEIPGASAETYIVVRQLAPGLRARGSFKPTGPLPSDEAPEHIAHAVFDLIMKFPGRLLPVQEWQQLSRAYEVAADPGEPSHDKPRYRH